MKSSPLKSMSLDYSSGEEAKGGGGGVNIQLGMTDT